MGNLTGKAYCPSNGSEGTWFTDKFCFNCKHEKFMHTNSHKDALCELFSNSLIYDIKEPGFPKEWVYDKDDKPTCTAHEYFKWDLDESGNLIDPPPPPDPNQVTIEFEVNKNV